jgi:diguanylate cyclase (GGDEF)-like protein
MASLYLAGATIGVVSLLLPHSAAANDGALWSNIALAYAGGAALLLVGPRLPGWSFHAALALGSVLVTRAVYYSGEPVSFYSVWYIWIGLYAFYFFDRAGAVLHVTFVSALYAWSLTMHDSTSPVARWLTTVATLAVAGVFIDTLVRRARRQAEAMATSAGGLALVADVAHGLSRLTDSDSARPALCRAAAQATRADTVALWEPAPTGSTLMLTGSFGQSPSQKALPFVAAPAGGPRAFTNAEPVLGEGLDDTPEFMGAGRPPRLCLWQPILGEGGAVGVLAFYWASPHALDDPALRDVASLLAVEAAVTFERVHLLARLEAIARTDDLTGLPNRRAWEEELPREVLRATREERPLCVAMIDLDHFKRFNDERGHQAGDLLLKQAAAAWSGQMRGTDFLARYGGEEFALALPTCPPDEAIVVVERIRTATPGGETASAGIAHWDGRESAGALLGRADAALYEAKRSGRDRTLLV